MRALELRIYILCGRASRTRDVLRLAPDDVLPGALLSAFQTRYQAVVAAGESSGRRSANTSYQLGSWTTGQKREGRVPMTRPSAKTAPETPLSGRSPVPDRAGARWRKQDRGWAAR